MVNALQQVALVDTLLMNWDAIRLRMGPMSPELAAKLTKLGHYPVPLHLQKAYERLGYQPGAFPVAEKLASEIVSLPMFPQLMQEQQLRVVKAMQKCAAIAEISPAESEVRYAVAAS